MHTSRAQGRAGFTLAEVIVALAIVALAVSLLVYLADAFRISRVSVQESEQTAYLQAYLSQLKTDWREPETYESGVAPTLQAPAGVSAELDVTANEDDSLRTLTLTLSDAAGRVRSLSTQIVRPLPEASP